MNIQLYFDLTSPAHKNYLRCLRSIICFAILIGCFSFSVLGQEGSQEPPSDSEFDQDSENVDDQNAGEPEIETDQDELDGSDQTANPGSEGSIYRSLETFARGLYFLESMYVDPTKVEHSEMVQNALIGIVRNLDPHTVIMPAKAFKQLTVDTQGKFGGVGIIISQEKNKVVIVSVVDDSPASRAGLKSGDEITAINGSTIKGQKAHVVVDEMRGEPGSAVVLRIKRTGLEKPMEFELVREVIRVASTRFMELSRGQLYLRITSFQENTSNEMKKALEKYVRENKRIKGLVLDLRDNPGGLLDQAVKVSDLFLESGVIVSTVGRNPKEIEREFAAKKGTFTGFPIVTLVNGGSASASEIVAGALQDHNRSVIMGGATFGKGSVQTLVPLPDGSGLKLTIARYYTPKDRSIQAKGIEPDIVISSAKSARPGQKIQKEKDLKGHIEGKDLSDLSKNDSLIKEVNQWPEFMRQDYQLVTAFSYLKSFSIFQKNAGF